MPKKTPPPEQAEIDAGLRALVMTHVAYDAETGQFRRLVDRTKNQNARPRADRALYNGYREVAVAGRRYLAHRLVWLIVHGRWPAEEVDHIDRDRSNNRLSNLREATHEQNCWNVVHRTGSTGLYGATTQSNTRRFRARLCLRGAGLHLGYFDTAEQAHAAVVAKRAALRGQFVPQGDVSASAS